MKPTPAQEARAARTIQDRQLTIEEWLAAQPVQARGETCTAEDLPRLNEQALRVYGVLRDLRPHTLRDIAASSGDPEASVSARIRQIRDYLELGGKGTVLAESVSEPRVHWLYTLKLNRYYGAA